MRDPACVLALLWRTPWWSRLALMLGLAFPTLLLAQAPFDGSILEVGGVACIWVVCFLTVLPLLVPETLEQHADFSRLTPDERRTAMRAAVGGPVPRDPEVRAAALQQVEAMQKSSQGRSTWDHVWFVVAIAYPVTLAIAYSPWWWLAVVLFAALPLRRVVKRPSPSRRARALRSAEAESVGPPSATR